MRRLLLSLVVTIAIIGGLFLILERADGHGKGLAQAAQPVPPGIVQEQDGDNIRTVELPEGADVQAEPNMGFIDSPTAICYQPDPTQDQCYINWYYSSVNASPNYMVAMTATVQSRVRARYHGFFQTSMYVPYTMQGDGLRVACGPLGAGGNPSLGNAYPWSIQAIDSAQLKSSNYGTVYCPAYIP